MLRAWFGFYMHLLLVRFCLTTTSHIFLFALPDNIGKTWTFSDGWQFFIAYIVVLQLPAYSWELYSFFIFFFSEPWLDIHQPVLRKIHVLFVGWQTWESLLLLCLRVTLQLRMMVAGVLFLIEFSFFKSLIKSSYRVSLTCVCLAIIINQLSRWCMSIHGNHELL